MPVPMAVIMVRISSCAQHLVVAGFFDVEDFALQRKNGLIAAVAAGFGGAAGRFTLHQEQFATVRIALLAIGKFARQAAGIESAFTARQIAGFASRFAGASRVDRFGDDLLHHRGILVEKLAQLFIDELDDITLNVGIEFALGLAFELRLRQLHADHRGQAFANVVAGQIFFDVFEEARCCPAALMVRVSALRNPLRCEPPSTVLMLLAKLNTVSL